MITREQRARNISHASILDLLRGGKVCGVSEGCSVRRAPTEREKRGRRRRKKPKKKKKKKKGRKAKNGAGSVEYCALIDVSNADRIVQAEINGAGVKKQNTCLCCHSTHRR